MIYLKRFLPFILSFSIIITFFVRPFSAEAVNYPVFHFDDSYISSSDFINLHGYSFAYILVDNGNFCYTLSVIFYPYSFLDSSSIDLFSRTGYLYPIIFKDSYISQSSVTSTGSSADFFINSNSSYVSLGSYNYYSGFPFNNSSSKIIASSVDLSYNGSVIFKGSQSDFLNFFDSSSSFHFFSSNSTGSGTGSSSSISDGSDNASKQVQISNNILTNIKSIISSILNLPSRIADSVSSFFSDVKNGIVNALYSVRDSIIQGLKDLFVPSSDVFDGIKNEFSSRFGFIYQIKDLVFSFVSSDYSYSKPDFPITIYGTSVNLSAFDFFDKYKSLIHGIILAFAWIPFLIRLFRRIPSIIFMYKGDND